MAKLIFHYYEDDHEFDDDHDQYHNYHIHQLSGSKQNDHLDICSKVSDIVSLENSWVHESQVKHEEFQSMGSKCWMDNMKLKTTFHIHKQSINKTRKSFIKTNK